MEEDGKGDRSEMKGEVDGNLGYRATNAPVDEQIGH
jgi:hypothetical protein